MMELVSNLPTTTKSAHAVLVTGYEVDFQGKIVGLKIQNSWGKEAGDGGFFYMSSQFLWKFFQSLSP